MSEAAKKIEPAPKVRPFVKMAGGKTGLLDELQKRLPKKFKNYHEPFIGGGAFYFHLGHTGQLEGKIARISDTNAHLVATYRALQEDWQAVHKRLIKYKDDKTAFYEARADDPLLRKGGDAAVAAWLIYLNKTCFNGLWRVNTGGRFNVPYAEQKKPRVRHLDPENHEAVSVLLNKVKTEITHCDFAQALEYVKKGDVVYFDPPYVPVSKTSDFARYTVVGFHPKDQERLRDRALELKERGVHVILSNSIAALDLYQDRRFKVEVVEAVRSINSNGDKRGAVKEIIVT